MNFLYVIRVNLKYRPLHDESLCKNIYSTIVLPAHRPPVEDIQNFLESTKSWILEKLFGGRELSRVAHGLVGKKSMT